MYVCVYKNLVCREITPVSPLCHLYLANPETWQGREIQRAFHRLRNSTAMSHPGLRLLACWPHPIPVLRVRGLDLQFLTLELGKEVEDDTADIRLFLILEQISKIRYQGSEVWKSSSCCLVCWFAEPFVSEIEGTTLWSTCALLPTKVKWLAQSHSWWKARTKSQTLPSDQSFPGHHGWLTHEWQMLCRLLKEVEDIQETSSNLVRMYHCGRKLPCSS